MSIDLTRLGRGEQMFSFHHEERGELYHFAVDRLNAYLKWIGTPLQMIELTAELVDAVANQNGIEPEHLGRLTADDLEKPLTFLDMNDGTHIVCDGSHRLLVLAMRGEPAVAAYVAQPKVWRRFLVTGMPGGFQDWDLALKAAQNGNSPYRARNARR